jgi:hypothetical protein
MAGHRKVVYNGEVYLLQKAGRRNGHRYFMSDRKDLPERLLHRQVWRDQHGPIPPEHDIHHRDGNPHNNAADNLECVPSGRHRSEHTAKRMADPSVRANALRALRASSDLAAEWHRSDEGREWHSEHGRRTWESREPVVRRCAQCGADYETFFPSRSAFCSRRCNQRATTQSRRYDTDRRTCAHCGKEFVANRHRATKCCSRVCSNRKRAADARL